MEIYISGKIININRKINSVVLESNYKGYYIYLSNVDDINTEEYKKVFVHKYTDIKGNETMYGFMTFNILIIFKKLLKVRNVGPKTIMKILSFYSDDEINKIINEKLFYRLAEVGIKESIIEQISDSRVFSKSSESRDISKKQSNIVTKLTNIGYQKNEISNNLAGLQFEDKDESELIKEMIKKLSDDNRSRKNKE